jgi:hydroxymethylpyrimidine pyrophosphatase-like HAD family hydrolase
MRVVVFSDLDDTLFQSGIKCADLTGHTIATKLPDGSKGAYSTPQQQVLTEMLLRHTVIPVTGRRTESLHRVEIDFKGYKVASHGAIIVDSDNELLPEWQEILRNEVPEWEEPLRKLKDEVEMINASEGFGLRVRIIKDMGYPCYICVKGESKFLKILKGHCDKLINITGFVVHINNRNLAFMPPYTSKRRSVCFLKNLLMETNEALTFIGVGDSYSDAPFMSECDFQIIPSNSQIAGQL